MKTLAQIKETAKVWLEYEEKELVSAQTLFELAEEKLKLAEDEAECLMDKNVATAEFAFSNAEFKVRELETEIEELEWVIDDMTEKDLEIELDEDNTNENGIVERLIAA